MLDVVEVSLKIMHLTLMTALSILKLFLFHAIGIRLKLTNGYI